PPVVDDVRECHHRTSHRDAPPRVSGPDHHPRRAASPVGPHRVRRVLQPGTAAPDTAPRDTGAGAALSRGASAITTSARWSASRVRASSLTIRKLLRPHRVNCGSPYCRKCVEGGQGSHGPYWYRYLWRDGKHLKRYVGKQL